MLDDDGSTKALTLDSGAVSHPARRYSRNIATNGRSETVPNAMTSMSSREFNQGTGDAKKAALNGPVCITDRGRPAFVLLSFDHYRQLLGDQPSLVEMLCSTPGAGDVDFEVPKLGEFARPATFD